MNATAAQTKSLEWLNRLRANPKIPLIVAGSAAVAVMVALILWAKAPDYRTLFSNLSDQDGGAIVSQLTQMNIPYRVSEASGAIEVPADKVHELRLRLAQQGLPKGGAVGFELLDQEKFGISQFSEQVNYQRALEGELSRTIETIGPVKGARVHLAMPKPSLFVREQKSPSASVTVNLLPGRALDEGQISAIVHLVSGSIPGLQASKVSVVDQAGNLLTDGIGAGEAVSAATRKRDQILKDIQDKTRASVANVLDSLVGTGNYRVSVMPDLDLSTIDETQEHYGDAPKINREESVLDSDTNQVAMGVPGSLSNRPPVAANQMTNGTEENRSPEALSKPSESKRDYSYDRSVQHIQHPGFAVKRLNVAVVLNQNAPALKNWKPEQTTQLTALLNNAAGIDAQRGDNLTLSLLNFVPQVAPVEPVIPLWKDDSVLAWVRLIGCGLLALLCSGRRST